MATANNMVYMSITYDAGSRITALTDKMGLSQRFTYDAHGNVTASRATNGLMTHFRYDILDRLTMVTDPMGNETMYDYDVMGNITAMTNAQKNVTKYTYDLEGNMTSLTSPMGRKEQFAYDAGGRMKTRLTAKGDTIRYDYDILNGLAEKTYEDQEGAETDRPVQMGYNAMGQRISMEDITGESTYTYDSLGRLKTATNGSGKTVEYYYDEADNLWAILYPDGREVQYTYDKNDNITKIRDRDGRETFYSYDPLNRLTKVKRAAGSTSTYTYNARDQIVEAENLCSCGFLISSYKYTYDDAGLIVGETAKECLFASNKDYGHKGGPNDDCAHVSDNPWQNQNPQWQTTKRTFKYDDNGQLIECKEDKGMFDKTTYTYEYDSVGNRTLAKKYEMFEYRTDKTTYAYNADNKMVSAVVCEGNLTKRYTFKYDANGNLTQECLMNRAEVTYQYDTENRLKAVNDRQKLLMAAAYDGDGNRTFQLNYNPEAECGYGKNVNGEVFMPENSKNEDGSLTAEGDLFSYICSATGRAYDLTEYVNDTNRQYTEVLTAYTVNSGATESYSYNGSQRLSRNNIWNEARGVDHNETSYYLYDGRGSVTANTWQNGMVTNVYQYDPYGQVTLGSTEHTDFYGYNAESYNPNTGLEYLRARYYNADKGRFFQEDTYLGDITDPLTLNRYAYAKNSPLNYIDPSGFRTEAEMLGDEAHVTLQMLLQAVGGPLIEREYIVENHPINASHKGRADIVFYGPLGAEVYEIKPASYLNKTKKYTDRYTGELKTLNQMGHDQRRYYIEGMKVTHKNDGSKPYVVDSALSLFPIFSKGLILPSFYDGDKFIKYKMYSPLIETGMIYYQYLNKQEERAYQKAYEKATSIVEKFTAKCQLDPAAESIINVFPKIPGLNIDWNSVLRPPTVGEAAVTTTGTLVIAILAMLLLV